MKAITAVLMMLAMSSTSLAGSAACARNSSATGTLADSNKWDRTMASTKSDTLKVTDGRAADRKKVLKKRPVTHQ